MRDACRLLFVGGAPRSGTTLVQNILDSHPAIMGGPEFRHVADLVRVRNALAGSVSKGWIEAFCSTDDVDRLFGDLIEKLLLPLADRHGARILSEKTPSNVLVFKELMDLFPEARFVFVARDPRAVASSMLEVGARARRSGLSAKPFTRSTQEAVRHIHACFRAAVEAAAHRPDRMITVNYERIVEDTECETRRLCDFLGLDWSEAMLSPGRQSHLGAQPMTSRSGNLWYDARSFQRDPELSEIDKWTQRLSPHQRAVVTAAFAGSPETERFGYAISGRSLSVMDRARGMGLQAVDGAKRRLRRAARAVLS